MYLSSFFHNGHIHVIEYSSGVAVVGNFKSVLFATEHLTRPQSSLSSTTPPSRQGRRKSSGNWMKARTSLALSGELKKRGRNKK